MVKILGRKHKLEDLLPKLESNGLLNAQRRDTDYVFFGLNVDEDELKKLDFKVESFGSYGMAHRKKGWHDLKLSWKILNMKTGEIIAQNKGAKKEDNPEFESFKGLILDGTTTHTFESERNTILKDINLTPLCLQVYTGQTTFTGFSYRIYVNDLYLEASATGGENGQQAGFDYTCEIKSN